MFLVSFILKRSLFNSIATEGILQTIFVVRSLVIVEIILFSSNVYNNLNSKV